jgi:hypothetical protein
MKDSGAHTGGCAFRGRFTTSVGAACALVATALIAGGCDSRGVPEDAAASSTAQVNQLRRLERPVVRHLKLSFTALMTRRQLAAAEELERGTEKSAAVLEWLDRHEEFAHTNADALECLEESIPELQERAERLIPLLRRGSVSARNHRELRIRIAEAVNCIQASD